LPTTSPDGLAANAGLLMNKAAQMPPEANENLPKREMNLAFTTFAIGCSFILIQTIP
jgi:hypothetical protein